MTITIEVKDAYTVRLAEILGFAYEVAKPPDVSEFEAHIQKFYQEQVYKELTGIIRQEEQVKVEGAVKAAIDQRVADLKGVLVSETVIK